MRARRAIERGERYERRKGSLTKGIGPTQTANWDQATSRCRRSATRRSVIGRVTCYSSPPPPSMSTTCNDVYLGLPDDDYFGLLGDDDLLPPPLPMGFDLPRKPPVNAAVHFCETQTPGRSDNHAAAAAEAKHGGSGAVAEEHCDVGVEYCSPYLKSGSEEETDCCGVGAAHHYWKHSMEEWSDRGTSLLDKDTERFKYLNGGQSRGDDSRAGDQQAAHRQEYRATGKS
ncbi:hypothetical protein HU200_043515 [Digitaria exilis]|uniref:Uncharacterized protein n=1 Tax=Digitaria exilis TaxID=1010633 RepID=A0A835B0J8_9POAL|nr:hypothetical protein HU200_043515 [Digitaria exilis]